jgi:hypothetical protein
MSLLEALTPDFTIIGLFDAGVPNSERIVIQPNRQLSLAGVGIAVGVAINEGDAAPIFDNIFWFPGMIVEPPVVLYVYTGQGATRQTTAWEKRPALVFHWQRPVTIFNSKDIVPILFRLGSWQIISAVSPLPPPLPNLLRATTPSRPARPDLSGDSTLRKLLEGIGITEKKE